MILMPPTSSGLQKLLNVTSRLLDEEGLVLNVQKRTLLFSNRNPGNLSILDFITTDTLLYALLILLSI